MDNRYHTCNCPPLMSDGRFITSHIRGRIVDQYIREINNIHSAHEYKIFLQDNTNQILDNLNKTLKNNYVCNIKPSCNTIDLNKLYIKPKFVNNRTQFIPSSITPIPSEVTSLYNTKSETPIYNILGSYIN